MNASSPVVDLLPLLRCPSCRGSQPLTLCPGVTDSTLNIPLSNEHIACGECGTQYPITDDQIPLMLTTSMRQWLEQSDSPQPELPTSNMAANIAIYESVSDTYQHFARQESDLAKRMRASVRKVLGLESGERLPSDRQLVHLDWGCGPGQVLGWLQEFGFTQIGLDVSLRNLRNARRATGCKVVCGDATNLPFASEAIDVVTESSVLHHLEDWKAAVRESMRVCRPSGGIVIDCEPSKEQLAWSPLAIAVYNLRFPAYKLLSYVRRDKFMFRDMAQAKLNLLAEIHHQPGTGFPLADVRAMFENSGFSAEMIVSPTPELASQAKPNWKNVLMNCLSARNPWNPDYGPFTALARSESQQKAA